MVKLQVIEDKYRKEMVPGAEAFMANPPADPAKRQFEHKKYAETILAQILLTPLFQPGIKLLDCAAKPLICERQPHVQLCNVCILDRLRREGTGDGMVALATAMS